MRNFLNLNELAPEELRMILSHAIASKKITNSTSAGATNNNAPLTGKIVAMIFDKPSTRTRVSFDVGIKQLGGQSLILSSSDIHLGHGESISDTAKVLSRYVDLIIIRTFEEEILYELADNAKVPIINGLTNESHPCQVLTDIFTFQEIRGSIIGKKVVWLGVANNVFQSFLHAASSLNFRLFFSGPSKFEPTEKMLECIQHKN